MASHAESVAFLAVSPGHAEERLMRIVDRIFVGRECAGIGTEHQIIIDDPTASRTHFEIRLDPPRNVAYIVDTSTNGTHVNGSRLARAVPQPIRPGDRITIGDLAFEFRSEGFTGGLRDRTLTQSHITMSTMLMVVGDITNYSTISQITDSAVIASSLQTLYSGLKDLLTAHRGTLSNYAGDALYAVWEEKHIPAADELAVDFALAANRHVDEIAPELPLREPTGAPVTMGWGVVRGPGAVITLTHSAVSVVGDATNLAFRLSGLAGRGGRAPVIVAESARDTVVDMFEWGAPEHVPTKGRTGQETVFPVWGRIPQR